MIKKSLTKIIELIKHKKSIYYIIDGFFDLKFRDELINKDGDYHRAIIYRMTSRRGNHPPYFL